MTTPVKILKIALLAAALGQIVLFLFIALARLGYPYEIEWLEGGVLVHLARLFEGRPLYAAPSFEFVPFIYPPLYYWVAALPALVTGPGFLPLRLVSLLASLAGLGLIFALVRRETRSPAAGLLAAGLYAAAFPLTGFWFDLARVDPLFIALVLGGVYALRSASAPGSNQNNVALFVAGLLFAAAFFAKQTAPIVAAPLVLHSLIFQPWRRKWIFPLALAAPVALGVAALDRASQGWFSFYVLRLPGRHALDDYHLWRFWALDLARPLPVACGAALLWLARPPREGTRAGQSFFVLFAAGAFAAAWSSRLHSAGFNNVVMPAYAAVATLFGLAFARFINQSSTRQDALAMLLCLIQFLILLYNPLPQIPTRADRLAGDAFVARLRAVPGAVLVPYHDYLTWRAGKPPHAHMMAVLDVVRGDPALGARLEGEIRQGLQARRWTAIFLDSEWYPDLLEKTYESTDFTFRDGDFLTRTGMHIRPGSIYTPKK